MIIFIRCIIIIGASLSEPHVVRSTAEISVVCLSSYVRKTFAASIRIRALILHLAGDNLAASMPMHNTWHSLQSIHYKDITDSEARRQEKLRRRGEGD